MTTFSISPRFIELRNGLETGEFKIKNSSKDDTLILFKVRGSSPRLLEFSPKQGVIEPGIGTRIKLNMVHPNVTLARLVVKIITINRSDIIAANFRKTWDMGSHTSTPTWKKVVEIRNKAFQFNNFDDIDDLSLSGSILSGSFPNFPDGSNHPDRDDSVSPTSMLSEAFQTDDDECSRTEVFTANTRTAVANNDNETNEVNSNVKALIRSDEEKPQSSSPGEKKLDVSKETNDHSNISLTLGSSFVDTSVLRQVIDGLAKSMHSTDNNASGRDNQRTLDLQNNNNNLLMGIGVGIGVALGPGTINKNQSTSFTGTGVASMNTNQLRIDTGFSLDETSELARNSSRLVSLSASKSSFSSLGSSYSQPQAGLLLDISGALVNDSIVMEATKLRLSEALISEHRIVALEISDAAVTSLRHSISPLVSTSPTSEDGGSNIGGSKAKELDYMRAAIFKDNLKHITMTCTSLSVLDISINCFVNLASLDLSNNAIRQIEGPIVLPNLLRLNLSNNRLRSLDFLQSLVSLRTLVASSNELPSLLTSVNMLVSLSKSLIAIDLSCNPVCSNQRYAEEVINILPGLRYFDSLDISSMRKAYGGQTNLIGWNTDGNNENILNANGNTSYHSSASAAAPNHSDFELKLRRVVKRQANEKRFRQPMTTSNSGLGRLGQLQADIGGNYNYSYSYNNSAAIATPLRRSVAPSPPTLPSQSNSNANDSSYLQAYSEAGGLSTASSSRTITTNLPSEYTFKPKTDSKSPIHMTSSKQQSFFQSDQFEDMKERESTNMSLSGSVSSFVTTDTRRSRSPSPKKFVPLTQSAGSKADRHKVMLTVDSVGALLKNKPVESSQEKPAYMKQTTHSNSRRKSQEICLISHWGDHRDKRKDQSTTMSFDASMLSTGLSSSNNESFLKKSSILNQQGYHSDGDLNMSSSSHNGGGSIRTKFRNVTLDEFIEMQEDPRYGIWNPRYRVQKPHFGYSKPFIHREKEQKVAAVLAKELAKKGVSSASKGERQVLENAHERFVYRLREGFEKQPMRGTFARADRGLPAEWYPMDSMDVEAIRRQGYFHEVIGQTQKNSFRDLRSLAENRGRSMKDSFNVTVTGSVQLSPQKVGRRGSMGKHLSRIELSELEDFSHTDHFSSSGSLAGSVFSSGTSTSKSAISPTAASINASIAARRRSSVNLPDAYSDSKKWIPVEFAEEYKSHAEPSRRRSRSAPAARSMSYLQLSSGAIDPSSSFASTTNTDYRSYMSSGNALSESKKPFADSPTFTHSLSKVFQPMQVETTDRSSEFRQTTFASTELSSSVVENREKLEVRIVEPNEMKEMSAEEAQLTAYLLWLEAQHGSNSSGDGSGMDIEPVIFASNNTEASILSQYNTVTNVTDVAMKSKEASSAAATAAAVTLPLSQTEYDTFSQMNNYSSISSALPSTSTSYSRSLSSQADGHSDAQQGFVPQLKHPKESAMRRELVEYDSSHEINPIRKLLVSSALPR